jgi:hypothetical protein
MRLEFAELDLELIRFDVASIQSEDVSYSVPMECCQPRSDAASDVDD